MVNLIEISVNLVECLGLQLVLELLQAIIIFLIIGFKTELFKIFLELH